MKVKAANTALLLFTRSAHDEGQYKQLLTKNKTIHQPELFRQMGRYAQQLGRSCGLPFFIISSNQQSGNTFGEKLHGVLASFFHQGFEKLIVIGNDCPELKPVDILEAAALLQTKSAVFGPARDGGVYLLGLDISLFFGREGFAQLNWQTSTVLTELQNWAHHSEFFTLDKLYTDLDTAQDLKVLFFSNKLPSFILLLVRQIFLYIPKPYWYNLALPFSRLTHLLYFRGPPILV